LYILETSADDCFELNNEYIEIAKIIENTPIVIIRKPLL
jgi:hypothetical protein